MASKVYISLRDLIWYCNFLVVKGPNWGQSGERSAQDDDDEEEDEDEEDEDEEDGEDGEDEH